MSCPCGNNKQFENCCGRFLSGKELAKTPEKLMCSRYTAYALGGYGVFLLKTWHPAMIKDLSIESLSERHCEWIKLELLGKSQKGDGGTVEFKAFFINKSGDEKVLHEKSYFQRIAGHWLYVGAEQE